MGMVTNQMLLMRDAARNLKALPDIAEAAYMQYFERVQEECKTAIEHGQYESLWRNLALIGPRLLVESGEIAALVEGWWFAAKEGDQSAKENLHAALDALSIGSGRYETLTEEEREAIVADCKKWRPICEGLNEAFKELWKQSEYESSGQHRKEARGLLAEKYALSIKEVKTIERVLKTPSRRSNKSTPTEAMLQMIALDHVNRDVKTIEKIWGEYLDNYPEERRRKKRKFPTTPVAERTA